MTVSVDWGHLTINIPRADMTLVQTNPTEIRELEVNWFRTQLDDELDNTDGMAFLRTHNHTPPLDVGGVTLARAVEIINSYTITFEDGAYAVSIVGGNSNILDRVNVNQVSVRSANSAGLVTSTAIEFGEYGNAVTIDATNGSTGTLYPLGTARAPVNNIPDAIIIANARGFSTLKLASDLTLGVGDDVGDMIIRGRNPALTTLTILDEANVHNAEINECTVSGVLDGNSIFRNCVINDINYVSGFIVDSMINSTMTLEPNALCNLLRCFSGVPGASTPTINMNGAGSTLAIRGYNGGIRLINKTSDSAVSIDMSSGQIILDSTVVGDGIVLRGVAKLTDSSTGLKPDIIGLINQNTVSAAVWDVQLKNHDIDGSIGQSQKRMAFGRHCHVSAEGVPGTDFPLGVHGFPVDNITDAILIMVENSLHELWFNEDFVVADTDILDGYVVRGAHTTKSTITITDGASTEFCEFHDLTLSGKLSGWITARDMVLEDVDGLECVAHGVMLSGNIGLNGTKTSHFLDCYSGGENQQNIPELNFNGAGRTCSIKGFKGGMKIVNKTGPEIATIVLDGGLIVIDGSVTNGTIIIAGLGTVINDGTATIDTSNLMKPAVLDAGLTRNQYLALK